ncbi:MAG TPA: SIS domain-containing protein [Ruminiclostridium sp.]
MRTQMWKEINDQGEVAQKVIDLYSLKLDKYNSMFTGKNKILLLATGASLNACDAAKYAFSKYRGIIPHVIPAAETNYIADNIDKDTIAILVSQSGESLETKIIAQLLKDRKVEFFGMTNNPESFLASKADEVLLLHAGQEVSSATKTNMASLLILYILAAGNDKAAMQELQKIPNAITKTLSLANESVPLLVEILKDEKNVYILGVGMNAPTAKQGSLLMKEKTFIHTEGLSVSDFRHGSVEVIEEGLPIILCASTSSSIKEAAHHARYLKNLGADVYLIVDNALEAEIGVPESSIVKVAQSEDEIFSSIINVIPLQLLAEGIAAAKGYDVDGFRYLSKIVDKY